MGVDPCGGQPGAVVADACWIDNVQVLFALIGGLLEERTEYVVLLVLAVEKCADMKIFERGTGKR